MSDVELPVDPALAPTIASDADQRRARAGGEGGAGRDPEAALPIGTLVAGQYRIEAELGAGGMGIVYRARDQRLDRDVALKVCRALGERALARFEREAMALARLSHPNVVTVYQVGSQDGRLFIVMEAVAGGTARAWAVGRSWREVVALYAAAGEGLAAAHDAGLVHRDFKPDNVLVGEDGRPRVGDFGLAHAVAGDVPRAMGSGEVTHTGTVLGTPAYMPPEQRAGQPLDARADQYAYCVALWEALFEELPYAGPTVPLRRQGSGRAGLVTPRSRRVARSAKSGGAVPRHVIDALRRGLSAAPSDRWPSMAALIAELRRDPSVPRRRVALAGGVAAVAAAAAVGAVLLVGGRASEPAAGAACDDAAAKLAPVWTPERAQELQTAVGPAPWAILGPALARFTDDWTAGYAAACRAPRGAPPSTAGSAGTAGGTAGVLDLRERRLACLSRVRAELDGFLDEILAYPQQAPALEALSHLTAPAACAATDHLAEETPPPADPEALAKIERAARVIARAESALFRGAQSRASLLTNDALSLARGAGWRMQIAQALALRGWALAGSGRTLEARGAYEEAASIAVAERSDREAAGALAELAQLLAADGHADEARRTLGTARSLWARAKDPATGDRLATAEIEVALESNRTADAVAAARAQAAAPDASPDQAAQRAHTLARVLVHAGAYEEAERVVLAGIAASEQRLGKDAPVLLSALRTLVAAQLKLGKVPEALAAARRAVAIAQREGADGVRMSSSLAALGEAARATGDLPAARSAFERALQIERELGPGRRGDVAMASHNLALVEVMAGDLATAGRRGAEALETLEGVHGADRPVLIPVLVLVGYVARERGELAASEAHLRRALAIAERSLGPEHDDTANNRIELANTLVRAKRPREAIDLLEPILRATGLPKAVAAEARFALARALTAAGRERARAQELALDARDRYRALGEAMAPRAAEVDAWLSAGGRR